jgi:ppGpp synthetase/RelA/SpoT-type nucleotidyltranferase
MAWTEPEHSVERVNAAGKAMVRYFSNEMVTHTEEEAEAIGGHLDVVDNFRKSHNFPLNTFQISLRNSARKFDDDPLVAQRTKRLNSIWLKLTRSPRMKLSQMQDIGGCRAVMTSIKEVRHLASYYVGEAKFKHELSHYDDYLAGPKDSGYRGVHLIYKYFSDRSTVYNGKKIEVQIRSRYQHAWATAVETVDMFVGQGLKVGAGDPDWRRFFALMGSVIAIRERAARVPGTPSSRRALIADLREYTELLGVFDRLHGYADALQLMQNDVNNAHWFLMRLDPREHMLEVTGFRLNEAEEAARARAEAERAIGREWTDTVLVSVESISSLGRAYPNYFADTRMFLSLLKQALEGRSRRIPTEMQLPLALDGSESAAQKA